MNRIFHEVINFDADTNDIAKARQTNFTSHYGNGMVCIPTVILGETRVLIRVEITKNPLDTTGEE